MIIDLQTVKYLKKILKIPIKINKNTNTQGGD